MEIIESILTKNDCYKAGRKITVKGLMLHSVGTPQPGAKVFVNNWNRPGLQKCVHAFIDANDGKVYKTLPWNHRGWHAGSSANNTHIGVEMCEPAQIKYTSGAKFVVTGNKDIAAAAVRRTYESAKELFAQLCVQYKLNPLTDICSHREGHAKGIASNHGDPEHLWNGLGLEYTMDRFRKDVADEVARITAGTPVEESKKEESVAPTQKPVEEPKEEPAFNEFKVYVSSDKLRIRTGPGTENATTGKYTGVGTFTISEVQNGTGSKTGWGKLKSGAGWISLDYAKRI